MVSKGKTKKISSVSSLEEGSLYIQEEEVSYTDYIREIYSRILLTAQEFTFDTKGEDGIVSFKVSKDYIKSFEDYILKQEERQEYLRRCIALKDRIGTIAVEYLCKIQCIDLDKFDKFVDLLPSKELILKDAKTYRGACVVSCGYYATDEGMLSLEIPKKLACGESIDEYPEQLQYHYYWYPSKDKKVIDADFTKSELLKSMGKKKELKQ